MAARKGRATTAPTIRPCNANPHGTGPGATGSKSRGEMHSPARARCPPGEIRRPCHAAPHSLSLPPAAAHPTTLPPYACRWHQHSPWPLVPACPAPPGRLPPPGGLAAPRWPCRRSRATAPRHLAPAAPPARISTPAHRCRRARAGQRRGARWGAASSQRLAP